MANVDSPSGFEVYSHEGDGTAPMHWYKHTSSDAAKITKGDAVRKDPGNAGYIKAASATVGSLLGVAAGPAATATTVDVPVYDSPDTIFTGQCSGSSAQNLVNKQCDIEGTSGIMEVNEDATTETVITIKGVHPSDEVGANGRVLFKITRHQNAGDQTA